MGRWRPPEKPGSAYITVDGFEKLRAELGQLKVKRKEVTAALSAAAAEGDRSENAEYIYRKKELAGIDRRVRYLLKRLPALTVVNKTPDNPEKIFFGAWIGLRNDNDELIVYRIVGPDEADFDKGWISMDSPVAKSLLGKSVDDEVCVETPQGKTNYLISSIQYTDPDESAT